MRNQRALNPILTLLIALADARVEPGYTAAVTAAMTRKGD